MKSQRDQLIELFRANDWKVSLGHILKTTLAAEYRARMSELRREGYVILLERGKIASENVYRMSPPDETGQLRMAI